MRKIFSYFLLLISIAPLAQTSPKLTLPFGHFKNIETAVYSPNGYFFVTSGWDKSIKLWSSSSGKLIRTFTGKATTISSIDISQDGSLLLAGTDNSVLLWNMQTGQLVQEIEQSEWSYAKAIFSHNSDKIIAGVKNQIIIYDQ